MPSHISPQQIITTLMAELQRLRHDGQRGQGTVEYVGIVLVVGALLLALKSGLGAEAGKQVAGKLTAAVGSAIGSVSGSKG